MVTKLHFKNFPYKNNMRGLKFQQKNKTKKKKKGIIAMVEGHGLKYCFKALGLTIFIFKKLEIAIESSLFHQGICLRVLF